MKSYWVVSPNVRANEATVGDWRNCSVEHGAAFMGWSPDEMGHSRIGPRFAGRIDGGILPGDVILIARRHLGRPEAVGFGEVVGEAVTKAAFVTPDTFGSLRTMKPFVSWSNPPAYLQFEAVVRHNMALAKLHPDHDDDHRRICEWMDGALRRNNSVAHTSSKTSLRVANLPSPRSVALVASPANSQLDYLVRTSASISKATKLEAGLLEEYTAWLKLRDRSLIAAKYGALRCDGIEIVDGEWRSANLVEAKCSARREYIRMAVGQLLDYEFQGRDFFVDPHKAILLPERPPDDIIEWLDSIHIKVIWQSGQVFVDNDNGRFP